MTTNLFRSTALYSYPAVSVPQNRLRGRSDFSLMLSGIGRSQYQGLSTSVVLSFRGRSHLLGQDDLHPLGHHHAGPAVDGLGVDVRDDGGERGGALAWQRNQHADAFPVVGQLDEVVPQATGGARRP